MRKPTALLGSLLFLVVAPGTIAGLAPWSITHWHPEPAFLAPWTRWMGGALIGGGAALLLDCFARFAVEGLGTPAPVAPPQHLVVSGIYRHVRNPMYVALAALIFGQALLLGSVDLLIYGAIVWLSMHVFVLAYEEPTLRRTFGAEYENFRANVPRWIPRLRAWKATP